MKIVDKNDVKMSIFRKTGKIDENEINTIYSKRIEKFIKTQKNEKLNPREMNEEQENNYKNLLKLTKQKIL